VHKHLNMQRKSILTALAFFICTCLLAQRNAPTSTYTADEENTGFKKENIFIGGGINLGFASNTFALGASPEIGYSVANWLDLGLGFNVNYASQRADPYYNGNIRQRNFSYGVGPFVRIYPINVLFLQGQLEGNWSNISLKDMTYDQSSTYKYKSTSFIAGIGYSQRVVGQGSFYTLIGLDLMQDKNSPYRDYNNRAIPVIRTGFNFYLKPSHKK